MSGKLSKGRAGTGSAERRQERAERLPGLSYEQILHTKVVFGTTGELLDRLSQLQEELGLAGLVAELDAGGGRQNVCNAVCVC
jgi:hypothetical protein